jgi:HEAT repeat protein
MVPRPLQGSRFHEAFRGLLEPGKARRKPVRSPVEMRCLGALGWMCCFVGAATAADGKRAERRAEAVRLVDALASGTTPDRDLARVKFIGEEEFVTEELSEVLHRTIDGHQREVLSYALSILAAHGAEAVLTRLLADENPAIRMNAAQGLGRIPTHNWRALVPLLKDGSSGVRASAAKSLGMLKSAAAGQTLLSAARIEGEPEVRATMLTAAAETGDRRVISGLTSFLGSSSEVTRRGAARGLCRLGAPKGIAVAQKLLASNERLERQGGIDLLDGAPAKAAGPVLRALLKDADASLAAKAARMLYQQGDRVMLDWLVLASAHASPEDKGPYERELEVLQLQDDQRKAILARAGGQ